MGEQWGTVTAAVIAAVGALAGTGLGVFVGRRQVVDQAAVEHGQWLRGQRQEAYIALLTSWDTGVSQFRDLIEGWVREERPDEEVWEEVEREVWTAVTPVSESMQRAIERVELLGPQSVEDACVHLNDALKALRDAVTQKGTIRNWGDSTAYENAWSQATAARVTFLTASRNALRVALAPGRLQRAS
ncbi:hypothetical protein [Streptomyces sp. CA-106131]|uniref:hypothetical protein n=1 Tax=Streptomyces sp. CA-106131 TaxID=3240045 RepID=UPI003D8FD67D